MKDLGARQKKRQVIDGFFLDALDEMFKEAGFKGFDRDFVKRRDWRERGFWKDGGLENFRRWFTQEGTKRVGWSPDVIRRELDFFEDTQGWISPRQA
jgi:hypothetical protein